MRRLFALATILVTVISSLSMTTGSANGCSLAGTATKVTGIGTCSGAITIPDGVTEIGDQAFINSALTSITIPNTVTLIGERAFLEASALKGVVIPDSLTEIGIDAFAGVNSMESFTVGASNSNYRAIDGVLFNKLGTELIAYPASKDATSYEIPNGVTGIGRRSFWGAARLTSITIPNGVTSIGNQSFLYTGGLISIKIPNSVTFIDANAFQGTGIKKITFPSSVASIGNDTFVEANALESIRFLGIEAPTLSNLSAPSSATAIINPGATGFTPIVDGKWKGLIIVTASTELLASEAAASVDALIVALPASDSISTANSVAITSARAAFNALNVAAKDLVTTLSVLVAAEAKLLSLQDTTADDVAERAMAERRAAARRAAEIAQARFDLVIAIKSKSALTLNDLAKADLSGATAKNISMINAEILNVFQSYPIDIEAIAKIVRKYQLIDKISEKVLKFTFQDLEELGLIDEKERHKVSITILLRKMEPEQIDTFEEIKSVVTSVQDRFKARAEALRAIQERIRGR